MCLSVVLETFVYKKEKPKEIWYKIVLKSGYPLHYGFKSGRYEVGKTYIDKTRGRIQALCNVEANRGICKSYKKGFHFYDKEAVYKYMEQYCNRYGEDRKVLKCEVEVSYKGIDIYGKACVGRKFTVLSEEE